MKRGQVEELLALTAYLPPSDRILMEHVLDTGQSISRIAQLYQRPPRQLQRQANAITKRLSNKLFRFVALHMNLLPAETRPTAKYVVLHGLSMRQTARTIGTTLHHVRQHMNTVQAAARLLA